MSAFIIETFEGWLYFQKPLSSSFPWWISGISKHMWKEVNVWHALTMWEGATFDHTVQERRHKFDTSWELCLHGLQVLQTTLERILSNIILRLHLISVSQFVLFGLLKLYWDSLKVLNYKDPLNLKILLHKKAVQMHAFIHFIISNFPDHATVLHISKSDYLKGVR